MNDTEMLDAGVNRALIVRQPWIDMILKGEKVWEMRSKPTKITGRIGLIEQGTGLIVGEVTLERCGRELTNLVTAKATTVFHKVDDLGLLKKWRYPWVLSNPRRYVSPVPYSHPKGAVTWVKI